MSSKKNILIFVEWYLPGYKAGGPIRSVANIVNSLKEDFNFYIVTSDRDINEADPYEGIASNRWMEKDGYYVAYLDNNNVRQFVKVALKSMQFAAIYFNGIFSKEFTLMPMRLIRNLEVKSKVIVAPRGMLGPGALRIKPFKKKVFLSFVKAIGFFSNVSWHATDDGEMNDIKSVFGKELSVAVVPNIALLKIDRIPLIKEKGVLKLVFFSRISPKKNLKYALNLVRLCKEGEITLDIYGTVEDQEYWRTCKSYIDKFNLNANFKGELKPENVNQTLSGYHYLFLPTLHENYGHVIAEALAAGCGLILSNNTPWVNLEEKQVGWDIDLNDKEKFMSVIRECLNMGQEAYDKVRNNVYDYIAKEIADQNAVNKTRDLFNVD